MEIMYLGIWTTLSVPEILIVEDYSPDLIGSSIDQLAHNPKISLPAN
jgi:hypothetical protein